MVANSLKEEPGICSSYKVSSPHPDRNLIIPLDLASSIHWNVFSDNIGIQNPSWVELYRTNGQFSSTTESQGEQWEGMGEGLQDNES